MKLIEHQKKRIAKIGKKHRLDFIVLHGSQATGKVVSVKPDIDIAVYRRGGIDFNELIDLTNEFMEIFGNKVDVKTLHKKDPLFVYLAMRDSVLLYGDSYLYHDFKAYSFKRFIDAKGLFRLRDILMRRGIDSLKKHYGIL